MNDELLELFSKVLTISDKPTSSAPIRNTKNEVRISIMDDQFLELFSKTLTIIDDGVALDSTAESQPHSSQQGLTMRVNYGNGMLIMTSISDLTKTEDIMILCKKFGHVVFCSVGNIILAGIIKRVGVAVFKSNADAVKATQELQAIVLHNNPLEIRLVNSNSSLHMQAYALRLTSLFFQFHTYDLINPMNMDQTRLRKILRYFEEFLFLYAN